MTFPREGKFTSSHFFASKDVMGGFSSRICGTPTTKSVRGTGAMN